jgi:hypothetical protein
MQYPLTEKMGEPDLLVGRKEFQRLNKWLANIPKRLSKSRVIMARRKSGKTAIVQRIFNPLWNQNKRARVKGKKPIFLSQPACRPV